MDFDLSAGRLFTVTVFGVITVNIYVRYVGGVCWGLLHSGTAVAPGSALISSVCSMCQQRCVYMSLRSCCAKGVSSFCNSDSRWQSLWLLYHLHSDLTGKLLTCSLLVCFCICAAMSDEPELKKEEAEKNEFSWPWGKDKDKDKVGASNMCSCGWSKLFQVRRILVPNLLRYESSGFWPTWPSGSCRGQIPKLVFLLRAAEYTQPARSWYI